MTDVLMQKPFLEICDLSKIYTTRDGSRIEALLATNLVVEQGEFVSFVGPSGCGKTTLLNMVSGLLKPTGGSVSISGALQNGPTTDISLVFQRPVLLPWRTILDNIMLPIEVLGLRPREKFIERAKQLMAVVGLTGFEGAYPRELSGGMQQRAAIVRSLIYDSKILLMDEPFAALDAMTRDDLNLELLRIWSMTKKTIIFITHNIAEAVLLSDRIVVMTPRPGEVRALINVDIARPRKLNLVGDKRFGEIVEEVRRILYKSV